MCRSGCGSENNHVLPAEHGFTRAQGPVLSVTPGAVIVWRSTQYSTRSGLASQASNGLALLGTASASTVIAQLARSRAKSS